jgi:hypothetical protein
MSILLDVLFVILSLYFLIGAIFLSFLRYAWMKDGNYRYQLLVEEFRDVPLKALKFGLTWPLTFTHMVLHFTLEKGVSFKKRFLEAAAGHADEVITYKPDDEGL